MATRRKSKRSLSLRTASFIRLLTPFGNGGDKMLPGGKLSGSAQLTAMAAVREESSQLLHPAMSDSQLHVGANSVESYRRRQQIVDSSGRIIIEVTINKHALIHMLRLMLLYLQGPWEGGGGMTASQLATWAQLPAARSQPNLDTLVEPGRQSCLDTSWLAQEPHSGAPPGRRGLLSRCAVSYQNISPSGEIFGSGQMPCKGFTSGSSSDSSGAFSAAPEVGLLASAGGERAATTNVAWLVGATTAASAAKKEPMATAGTTASSAGLHHIDIRERGDLVVPAHLAVAPLAGDKHLGRSAGHASVSADKQLPVGGGTEERPVGGYSLARSQTIGNLPLWAQDLQGADSPPPPWGRSTAYGDQWQRGLPLSTVHAAAAAAGSGTAAATLSTRGSLRSKIGPRSRGGIFFNLYCPSTVCHRRSRGRKSYPRKTYP